MNAPNLWLPSNDLLGMMDRARAEGLWFFCSAECIWMSPKELESEWASGRFRWGAQNWRLCDPLLRIRQLDGEIQRLLSEQKQLRERIEGK